jgi:hypothetical protein
MGALYGTPDRRLRVLPQRQAEGILCSTLSYRWLETGGSQAVTEGRPQSTPVDAKAREYA